MSNLSILFEIKSILGKRNRSEEFDNLLSMDLEHIKSFYCMDKRAFCNPTNRKN